MKVLNEYKIICDKYQIPYEGETGEKTKKNIKYDNAEATRRVYRVP